MAVELFNGPRGAGIGICVPDYCLTNELLIRHTGIDTSDEWIQTNVGIKQRYVLRDRKKATSDLAIEAVRNACKDADIKPNQLDGVIMATVSGDFSTIPATASLVQAALRIDGFAFDVVAGCSGLLHGWILAKNILEAGDAKRIAVVGAETLSRFVDWSKRETCILFADAASCVILELSDGPVMRMSYDWKSKGDASLLCTPAGGSLEPIDPMNFKEGRHFIHMDGRGLARMGVREMSESMHETMKKAGSKISSYRAIIPHQANLNMIKNLVIRERLDPEQVIVFLSEKGAPLTFVDPAQEAAKKKAKPEVFVNIDRYGNTSSASIGIALAEADARGKQIAEFERQAKFKPELRDEKPNDRGAIRPNDRLLLVAFGAGPARASIDLKWKENLDETTPLKVVGKLRRIFQIPFSWLPARGCHKEKEVA